MGYSHAFGSAWRPWAEESLLLITISLRLIGSLPFGEEIHWSEHRD